jgi:hypothetical protein
MRPFVSLLTLVLVSGCTDLCGNDPLHGEESPDKSRLAVAFVRSCGATTGFSSHVSIVPRNKPIPNEPGNILVVEGKQPISVKWRSNSELEIEIPRETKIHKQTESLGEVSIKYKSGT